VFGRLTALPRRERALQVRVAFTRLQSVFLMFCLLLRLPLVVFTTQVEPKILFKRSGVIKSQIKFHQAIHDGMFSFIQL
jgi:hypothetical protein